jgi:hypothetical protein
MIQTRQPDYLIAIFFCEYLIAIFTNTKKSQKGKKRQQGARLSPSSQSPWREAITSIQIHYYINYPTIKKRVFRGVFPL